jgi:hypothetical protein
VLGFAAAKRSSTAQDRRLDRKSLKAQLMCCWAACAASPTSAPTL